jgi:hypothetical protein
VATDVTSAGELPAAERPDEGKSVPVVGADRRERARLTSYRFRFGFVYVLLAAVLGGAVGSFVVLVGRPAPADKEAWSSWKPEVRENAYPTAIADHVAARYRLPSGKQLVGVLAGPAEVQELPIRAVLIQHESSTPARPDDVEVIETGSSVLYNLCGTGARCSILEGEPTPARAQLLRREALELALYTFKYVDGIDSVIALMPVNLGDPKDETDDTSTALFLQAKDFKQELKVPLRKTLAAPPPIAGAELDPADGLVVDQLTRRRLYLYDIQPTQDLSAIMRLAPVTG